MELKPVNYQNTLELRIWGKFIRFHGVYLCLSVSISLAIEILWKKKQQKCQETKTWSKRLSHWHRVSDLRVSHNPPLWRRLNSLLLRKWYLLDRMPQTITHRAFHFENCAHSSCYCTNIRRIDFMKCTLFFNANYECWCVYIIDKTFHFECVEEVSNVTMLTILPIHCQVRVR